jgi:hypothetical protein
MYSLRARCTCSGELTLEMARVDMVRKMTVYGNIARFYKLELLGELLGFVFGELEGEVEE